MQLLRRRLPRGIVGAIFYPKAVVVDDRIKRSNVLAVVAIAMLRCDGCFAVVMRSDLERVLAMVG